MNIQNVRILLGEDSRVSQGKSELLVKSDVPAQTCAESVRIEFDGSFCVEIKENAGKTVLVLTAGGVNRVMDTAALRHLVAMTY